jgi:hypothetical protein
MELINKLEQLLYRQKFSINEFIENFIHSTYKIDICPLPVLKKKEVIFICL